MEKFRKLAAICFLVCTLFCGCEKELPPVPETVSQVDIYGTHDGNILRRHYTNPQKMETVLNFLRAVPYRGKTTLDPFLLPGDEFSITVALSGGEHKVYHVQSGGFLCRPGGTWEKADREATGKLFSILENTPSDH